jgi:class 3 adenylate cyclase
MRFGTKILLLTLTITVGLSAVVAIVVTRRISAREIERADRMTLRAIEDYADRIADRALVTRRFAQLLLEEPEVRAYLEQIDSAATGAQPADPATVAQLREEIFGRILQTELAFKSVAPAFHVLVNRRGNVVLIADPEAHESNLSAALRDVRWPYEVVTERGESPQLHLVGGDQLYHVFSVPARIELGDAWDFAYFAGYPMNDAWLRAFAGARGEDRDEELRVVVQLAGQIVARSAKPDAAEQALASALPRMRPRGDDPLVKLDFEDRTGERFIGEALVLPAGSGATIAFFSSLDHALQPLRELQRAILWTTLGVVLLAIVVSQLMSRLVAKPVEQLVEGTQRIARGEFKVPIDLRRRDELGELARSFNQMAAGLEQRDVIKDTFGKFVDPSIVQSLLDDPSRLRLGGERRVQTILFADLENFTHLAEHLQPEALFRLLNGYLEDAADVVAEHRGIIDKFIGDGVVAFWGPPLEENHPIQACRAALKLVQRTARHDVLCRELGLPPLRARVGLATGEVLVGNIGSRSKYNYTVMGDIANLASRLEGVNKLYGTQILTSAATARAARGTIVTRRIDTVRVLGRSEAVELYEVLGEADRVDGQLDERIHAYESGLSLYQQRKWREARDVFDRLTDAPARAMAGRCAVLAAEDPGSAWDGVWNLDRK